MLQVSASLYPPQWQLNYGMLLGTREEWSLHGYYPAEYAAGWRGIKEGHGRTEEVPQHLQIKLLRRPHSNSYDQIGASRKGHPAPRAQEGVHENELPRIEGASPILGRLICQPIVARDPQHLPTSLEEK